MAFRLRRKESVEDGVRRIAREEIDRALGEIASQELAPDKRVHQVRKRCKKLRSLLRLVRPALKEGYSQANARIRDAARSLSWVRDADVLRDALDQLAQRYPNELNETAAAPIRAALERYRRHVKEQGGDLDQRRDQFAAQMRDARQDAETWTLAERGFNALGGGLEQSYRRGRKALKAAYADPTPENFHAWRKQVKDHGYHLRLLRNVWKPEMQTRLDAAQELLDLLGEDHDLAVLHALIMSGDLDLDDPAECDAATFLALLDRRRAELQAEAYPCGLRLNAEKPSCLTGRFQRYWQVWRKHGPARRMMDAVD